MSERSLYHYYWLFIPLLLLNRFSRVQLCATPWTAAHQAPLSTGFSRQEYWSGLPSFNLGTHKKVVKDSTTSVSLQDTFTSQQL